MLRSPLQSIPEEDFTDDDICILKVSNNTNGAISTDQFQRAMQGDNTLQTANTYMISEWPIHKSLPGDIFKDSTMLIMNIP